MEKLAIDEIIDHCERKTEQYERLFGEERLETTPLISSRIKEYWEHRQVAEYLKKFKEYQQLEEQGRLVKLPIEDKKGDCRECVHTKTQCHHMEYKCSECPLTELFCDEFYLAIDRCYEDAYANGCLAGMDLAKSEAEAKLKELR